MEEEDGGLAVNLVFLCVLCYISCVVNFLYRNSPKMMCVLLSLKLRLHLYQLELAYVVQKY